MTGGRLAAWASAARLGAGPSRASGELRRLSSDGAQALASPARGCPPAGPWGHLPASACLVAFARSVPQGRRAVPRHVDGPAC